MGNDILKNFSKEYERKGLRSSILKNKIAGKSGVYAIILNRSISRLLGEDTENILYIGQTESKKGLINRLTHFFNCASNSMIDSNNIPIRGHNGGRMYFLTMKKHLGEAEDVLRFRYLICENGSSKDMESKLLIDYVNKFGEIPPLNNQSATRTLIKSLKKNEIII